MSRYRKRFDDPSGGRFGIPTFGWRTAPDGWLTRRQLRARGLCPGGQPIAGQVLWIGVGGVRVAYLYRVELAKPKRTATPAQLVAIGRALLARRTCPSCHTVYEHDIPRSLGECVSCAERASSGVAA